MKSSKIQNNDQNEEDCGVWLDTVQLKGKAKKKRSARPISKLLNPLTNGAGYNVAVALNFTQTKMELPKTKQSSISNFFTSHRRVLNKMSTGGPYPVAQKACFSSLPYTESATEVCSDFSNEPQWCEMDSEQRHYQLSESKSLMCLEKEAEKTHACSQNINNDFQEGSSVDNIQLIQTSEDISPSNNCDGHALKTRRIKRVQKDSEPDYLRSFSSQDEFNAFKGNLLHAEGRTSTQKTSKRLSLQNDKENAFPKSPKKAVPDTKVQSLSKSTKLEPLDLYEGFNLPIKWTKSKSSPMKKQNWQSFKDSDDESLSTLFTQDSQGFRVIAHRSPFKDQNNVNTVVPSQIKCLEEDQAEDEMLFTQDSQGNMVIKH